MPHAVTLVSRRWGRGILWVCGIRVQMRRVGALSFEARAILSSIVRYADGPVEY